MNVNSTPLKKFSLHSTLMKSLWRIAKMRMKDLERFSLLGRLNLLPHMIRARLLPCLSILQMVDSSIPPLHLCLIPPQNSPSPFFMHLQSFWNVFLKTMRDIARSISNMPQSLRNGLTGNLRILSCPISSLQIIDSKSLVKNSLLVVRNLYTSVLSQMLHILP